MRDRAKWNGLLLVDKPSGITSHDVVHRVRKILGQSSVGHSGTLDPLASGLMVLLLGQATKISDYLLSGDKGYLVKARFGVRSDTLDREGQILSQEPVQLDPEVIRWKAEELTGWVRLQVPQFSAVKIAGKKLYQYARENAPIDLPVREMHFYDLNPIEIGGDLLLAQIRCAKGGFIRAWVAELGERLGSGGIVEELRREWSDPYKIEDAIDLETLAQCESLGRAFIPLERCLPHWKAVTVAGRDERLLTNGQIPNDLGRRLIFEQKIANRTQKPVGIKVIGASAGELLSLLEAQPFKGLKIRRIFNPNH